MGWSFFRHVCFPIMFLLSFAGVYLHPFLWCLQESASSRSCGMFGLLFSLFLCLVPHYSHCHWCFKWKKKKKTPYIWSEINTIICKDECIISRKQCCFWPAGFITAENLNICYFSATRQQQQQQQQLVLASVCLNVSLTCALIHIQVQLESRAPPYTGLTELSLTYTLLNGDETGCE